MGRRSGFRNEVLKVGRGKDKKKLWCNNSAPQIFGREKVEQFPQYFLGEHFRCQMNLLGDM